MLFLFIDSGAVPIKGIRRLGSEPNTGTTALWATVLWKRMEALMDDICDNCSKVIFALIFSYPSCLYFLF